MLVLQIACGVVLGFLVLQWLGVCDAACDPNRGGQRGRAGFWVSMIVVGAVILWVSGAGPLAVAFVRTLPR